MKWITHLSTKRLTLRKMELADAAMLFQIWSNPEVTKFMNIDHFTDQTEARDMIVLLNNLAEEQKAIRYSIIEAESNRIIGSCGFNSLDLDHAKAEIGYDIHFDFWGNGYASEAISCLIDNAFHHLKLHRLEAKVQPENINSAKVLKKLKFTLEGTLRESEKSKGKWIDLDLYSLLATD